MQEPRKPTERKDMGRRRGEKKVSKEKREHPEIMKFSRKQKR